MTKPGRDPPKDTTVPAPSLDLRQIDAKRDVSSLGYRIFPTYSRAAGPWNLFLACLGAAILVVIVVVNVLF